MRLPHITAPTNTLQALFNLLVQLWSPYISDRMDSVEVPSQLANLQVEAGTSKWIRSLRRNFRYDPTSTLAADGITCVEAPVGRWLSEATPQDAWDNHPTWYISSDVGLDTNPGTEDLPLRTLAEWVRRVPAGPNVDTTVNIVSLEPSDIAPDMNATRGGRVLFKGVLSEDRILEQGEVTAYSARNPATNTPPVLTKATGDWTAFIGKMIYFPARGSFSFIAKDMTSGDAAILVPMGWTNDWRDWGEVDGSKSPQPGDEYVVYDLPIMVTANVQTGIDWLLTCSRHGLRFMNLTLQSAYVTRLSIPAGTAVFTRCAFSPSASINGGTMIEGAANLMLCTFGHVANRYDNPQTLRDGSVLANVLHLGDDGTARFNMLSGSTLGIGAGGVMCINSFLCAYMGSFVGCGDYICSIGGMHILQQRQGSIVDNHNGGGLYGSGITNSGLSLSSRSAYLAPAAGRMFASMVGDAPQLNINGSPLQLPNLIEAATSTPQVQQLLPNPVVCASFADLFGATFNGSCLDQKGGAYIGS